MSILNIFPIEQRQNDDVIAIFGRGLFCIEIDI